MPGPSCLAMLLIKKFGFVTGQTLAMIKNEPPRGKTNKMNLVFDQVRHKPTRTVTEDG